MIINFFGFLVILILGFFIWANDNLKRKMKNEKKENDSWKIVIFKSNAVIIKFYQVIALMIFVTFFVGTIINLNFLIKFSDVVIAAALVFMSQNMIEYFSLKFFCKKYDNT